MIWDLLPLAKPFIGKTKTSRFLPSCFEVSLSVYLFIHLFIYRQAYEYLQSDWLIRSAYMPYQVQYQNLESNLILHSGGHCRDQKADVKTYLKCYLTSNYHKTT